MKAARFHLASFEFSRASSGYRSPRGIFGLVLGALVFGWMATALHVPRTEQDTIWGIGLLGAAWASLAAVHAADGNQGSLVADVWAALEPRPRRRSAAITAAWLPICYVQALLTSAIVMALTGVSVVDGLAALHVGLLVGVPAAFAMTTVAVRVRGFSLLSGAVILGLALGARRLGGYLSLSDASGLPIAACAYAGGCLMVFILVGSRDSI